MKSIRLKKPAPIDHTGRILAAISTAQRGQPHTIIIPATYSAIAKTLATDAGVGHTIAAHGDNVALLLQPLPMKPIEHHFDPEPIDDEIPEHAPAPVIHWPLRVNTRGLTVQPSKIKEGTKPAPPV